MAETQTDSLQGSMEAISAIDTAARCIGIIIAAILAVEGSHRRAGVDHRAINGEMVLAQEPFLNRRVLATVGGFRGRFQATLSDDWQRHASFEFNPFNGLAFFRWLDIIGVTGSIPVPPTLQRSIQNTYSASIRFDVACVRDALFTRTGSWLRVCVRSINRVWTVWTDSMARCLPVSSAPRQSGLTRFSPWEHRQV